MLASVGDPGCISTWKYVLVYWYLCLNGSVCCAVMWSVVVKFGFRSESHDFLGGHVVWVERRKLTHHKFSHKGVFNWGSTDNNMSCLHSLKAAGLKHPEQRSTYWHLSVSGCDGCLLTNPWFNMQSVLATARKVFTWHTRKCVPTVHLCPDPICGNCGTS